MTQSHMDYRNSSSKLDSGSYQGKVFLWLFAAFLVWASSAAILGPLVPPALSAIMFVALIVTLLLSGFVRKLKFLSPIFIILVPAILGIVIYPVINGLVKSGSGNIVTMAALGTAIVFGLTAVYAWTSKKSIDRWMPKMFIALLAIIGISLLNAFIFHISILGLIISCVVLVIFTLYTFHDIQKLRDNGGAHGQPPHELALDLFLDIINIFTSLLNILGFKS